MKIHLSNVDPLLPSSALLTGKVCLCVCVCLTTKKTPTCRELEVKGTSDVKVF